MRRSIWGGVTRADWSDNPIINGPQEKRIAQLEAALMDCIKEMQIEAKRCVHEGRSCINLTNVIVRTKRALNG